MAKRIPPYVKNKVAEVARRVAKLEKNRIQRFRSPIFVLPEFADCPMLSVIVYAQSQEEVEQISRVKSTIGISSEWIVVSTNDIRSETVSCISQNEQTENVCMGLNKAAVHSTGKIIALFTSAQALLHVPLDEWVATISIHELHVLEASFEGSSGAIAVTRDMFLLGRGLDEMLEEANIAMQDFALRASLLGARLDKEFMPAPTARMNVDMGKLMVNEGSENFKKLYFAPR